MVMRKWKKIDDWWVYTEGRAHLGHVRPTNNGWHIAVYGMVDWSVGPYDDLKEAKKALKKWLNI